MVIIKQKLKVCSLSKEQKVIYLFIISHEGCFGYLFLKENKLGNLPFGLGLVEWRLLAILAIAKSRNDSTKPSPKGSNSISKFWLYNKTKIESVFLLSFKKTKSDIFIYIIS